MKPSAWLRSSRCGAGRSSLSRSRRALRFSTEPGGRSMTALGKRVSRLEARLAPDPDDPLGLMRLSQDEFNILLLDVYLLWLADPKALAELSAQELAEMSASKLKRRSGAVRGRGRTPN